MVIDQPHNKVAIELRADGLINLWAGSDPFEYAVLTTAQAADVARALAKIGQSGHSIPAEPTGAPQLSALAAPSGRPELPDSNTSGHSKEPGVCPECPHRQAMHYMSNGGCIGLGCRCTRVFHAL
jgi:hypothetical protein